MENIKWKCRKNGIFKAMRENLLFRGKGERCDKYGDG